MIKVNIVQQMKNTYSRMFMDFWNGHSREILIYGFIALVLFIFVFWLGIKIRNSKFSEW